MKKKTKTKAAKMVKTDLPELVTVMAKLVERLEALERKMDLMLSRTGSLPQEVRRVCQDLRRPEAPSPVQPSSYSGQSSPQNQGRTLYQAVCADCRKGCEVPFKPTGERPVYCKECFARRKSGGAPKAPVSSFPQQKTAVAPERPVLIASKADAKGKKTKPSKKKKR